MERTRLKIERVVLLPDEDGDVASPGQLSLDLDGPALSEWLTRPPWEDGWYDLKGNSPFAGYHERAYYKFQRGQGQGNWYGDPSDLRSLFGTHHALARAGHQWRGLASPYFFPIRKAKEQ